MKKQQWIGCLIVLVVAAGGAFYGGMKYGQSKDAAAASLARAARSQQFGGGRGGALGGMRGANGGGFTTGDVISKDDKSITLKLRDGGSKIIFYSPATTVMKSVSGTMQDVAAGESVMISGAANADGSVNAESIQVRSK